MYVRVSGQKREQSVMKYFFSCAVAACKARPLMNICMEMLAARTQLALFVGNDYYRRVLLMHEHYNANGWLGAQAVAPSSATVPLRLCTADVRCATACA